MPDAFKEVDHLSMPHVVNGGVEMQMAVGDDDHCAGLVMSKDGDHTLIDFAPVASFNPAKICQVNELSA